MSTQSELLACAAQAALAPSLGPVEVIAGQRLHSSERAIVMRAVARRTEARDVHLVLKAPVAAGNGVVRVLSSNTGCTVAALETSILPALRDLAARTHQATLTRWGSHELPLARFFR